MKQQPFCCEGQQAGSVIAAAHTYCYLSAGSPCWYESAARPAIPSAPLSHEPGDHKSLRQRVPALLLKLEAGFEFVLKGSSPSCSPPGFTSRISS